MPYRASDPPESAPIEGKAELVAYLESGCKPCRSFKLGTEHERFVYRAFDYDPVDYDSDNCGIRALLEGLVRFGWNPVYENDKPIALNKGDAAISLEPGGQFELSGTPLRTVHQISAEIRECDRQIAEVAGELGLCLLGLGFQPKCQRNRLPWMPKDRYRIMRLYMPKCGSLGWDMMQGTASVQANLDFSSEADMVKKFRVALALQPLATALFANSPFLEGHFSGYLSYRSHVWTLTDPDRCGMLPFVFEEGMGFERYTDYMLDVPMYFVKRNGAYVDTSGESFRDFLAGGLAALPGERPVLSDWENHLTTAFPEVRLKRHLEMRGADAGDSLSRVVALSALWAGLLYDSDSLNAAWERARDWSAEEREMLRNLVPIYGFKTPFRDSSVRDFCLWMLELSREGLRRRAFANETVPDETDYLDPLQSAADSGRTFAEDLLARYEGEYESDINLLLRDLCTEVSP